MKCVAINVIEGNANGENYLEILNYLLLLQLNYHLHNQPENGILQRLWWMQDGAPAYKLLVIRQRLPQVFDNRQILSFGGYFFFGRYLSPQYMSTVQVRVLRSDNLKT